MNIGHLARAMLGEARIQVQDAKALELKVGQVVRGVVVQMLDGEEAIISLNGTQVRAKLETPLQVGQATWLQVQPDSTNGSLVLRAALNGAPSDEMIARLLQQLGLKDTAVNRELLRQASDLGIQLSGKDAKALSALLSSQSASTADTRWIQSALITLQRGLPLTQQTVHSVMQAVHGTPLPQQLGNLLEQLQQIIGGRSTTASSGGQPSHTATQQLLGRLADAISDWLATAAGRSTPSPTTAAGDSSRGVAPSSTNGATTSSSASNQMNVTTSDASGRSQAMASSGSAGQAHGQAMATTSRASEVLQQSAASNLRGEMSGTSGRSANTTTGSSPATTNSSQSANLLHQSEGNGQPTGSSTNANTAANSQAIRSEMMNGAILRQLFQMLGLGYEHELKDRLIFQQSTAGGRESSVAQGANPTNQLNQANQTMSSHPNQTIAGEASAMPQPQPQPGSLSATLSSLGQQTVPTETIKGLLLQAAGQEQLPASLRESLQQVAQTITGQQLLLTADRAAPLTYVTMYVPFLNEQGEPMANVHIQTRKGKRGELDSNNCHLFFDLRLASLGEMMIDVQVTDRIVGLRVYNDHPLMQTLIDDGKQGIQDALEEMGYRLASFASAPIPEKQADASSTTEDIVQSTPISRYAAGSSYKGVDLRV